MDSQLVGQVLSGDEASGGTQLDVLAWMHQHPSIASYGQRPHSCVDVTRTEPAVSIGGQCIPGGHPRGEREHAVGVDYVAESNALNRHIRNRNAQPQNDRRQPRFIAKRAGPAICSSLRLGPVQASANQAECLVPRDPAAGVRARRGRRVPG